MTYPPIDPNTRLLIAKWRASLDEDIAFDEVRRAVLGQRLRDDHSTVVEDPLTDEMTNLLRAIEASEHESKFKAPGGNRRQNDKK